MRRDPRVFEWWRGGDDLVAAVVEDLNERIDLWVDAERHNQGIGTDALRTLVGHVFDEHGHHRIEIDPATGNLAAIRCYPKVGFKPVGVLRRHERGNDGTWHDSLLMDLEFNLFRG